MLYDPKWEVRVTSPSLDSLEAWLMTKPAHERYVTWSLHHCLLGQYAGDHGWDREEVSRRMGNFDPYCSIAFTEPLTFGAALERLRKLTAKR